MIEIVDPSPTLDVDPAEYVLLLGYPPGRTLEGRAAELASWARDWYATNGRPWVYARAGGRVDVDEGGITVDGSRFTPSRLRDRLRRADAHADPGAGGRGGSIGLRRQLHVAEEGACGLPPLVDLGRAGRVRWLARWLHAAGRPGLSPAADYP